MNNEEFLTKYEELLDKDYCNCNEMNCIDNNSPRRILNIAKQLQQENTQLKQQLKDKDEKISKVIEYCLIEREDVNGSKCDDMLEIVNKALGDDK